MAKQLEEGTTIDPVIDLQTYCDIHGVDSTYRFVYFTWFKQEDDHTISEWERLIKEKSQFI